MKNKKTLSNIKILIFNQDTGTVSAEDGVNILADTIETESGVLPLKDATRFLDEWNQKTYYMFNVDIPAKVESENLKSLRKSVSLSRIFDYDKKKPVDLVKLFPYIVIIIMVVFK